MASSTLDARVEGVRAFNRFYTRQIGLLQDGLYHSPFSLTEVRVLYELAHNSAQNATELRKLLGLDAGYLSRILLRFEKRGLIRRKPSPSDARQALLSITGTGRKVFAPLDRRAREDVRALVKPLPESSQDKLLHAMRTVEQVLSPGSHLSANISLRPHRPGDIGWVIHRHGVLYSHEYGWDEHFEALVARIASDLIHNFDPSRERCWIAERDGEIVGSVFLVKKSKSVAKLRMLYVEPSARGMGLGARLVDECIGFARQAGYRKIMLWTQSVLYAARHIYEKAGFVLVKTEPAPMFSDGSLSETWELNLAGKRPSSATKIQPQAADGI